MQDLSRWPVLDLTPRQSWRLLAGVIALATLCVLFPPKDSGKKAKAPAAKEKSFLNDAKKADSVVKAFEDKRFPTGNPRAPAQKPGTPSVNPAKMRRLTL